MGSPLRPSGAAALLMGLLTGPLAACAASDAGAGAGPARGTKVPAPDLCRLAGPKEVAALFHGKVTGCAQGAAAGSYTATFSGRAVLSGHARPASMAITLSPRYNSENGVDRWSSLGRTSTTRVPMIGVGENCVFDPTTAPQLVAVAKGVIISVSVKVTGAAVPRQRLADHLLRIGEATVASLG